MTKPRIVLVGGGMAGVRCLEEIVKLAPGRFDITVFGRENHPNYNRILLSKVLQGDTPVEDITLNDSSWFEENGIRLFTGETVIEADTARRRILTDKGRTAGYDYLILATGSLPFLPPIPGAAKRGVTAFRDIEDCQRMIEAAQTCRKAVVIGGGLLGLEAARGLLNLGMEVDVVHLHTHLMERQLDPTASRMLRKELEGQGMRFLLGKQSQEILGGERVTGLRFTDGSETKADLIVMAAGVRPNVGLAKDSGIETGRGILVNDYMETGTAGVYAVGECAEHRGVVYGLVAPLYEQGKVLAQRICGVPAEEGYQGSILATQLKVSGVDVFSAGDIADGEDTESILSYDGIRGRYRKIWVRGGRIAGAVLYGDSSEGSKLLGYIKQGADASVLDAPTAGDDAAGQEAYLCAMADSETVCSCNGVTKGQIAGAIREQGLQTFEDVRSCTKASSSCGGCKPLVSALLAYTLAHAEEPAAAAQPVCGCTPLSREALREAVLDLRPLSAAEAMRQLGWRSADGCAVCLPALRYYTGLLKPAAAEVPAAGMLADGTCAVVPRLYGGKAGAKELRRIADAMDRHGIGAVKVSGDGQLQLLGVPAAKAREVASDLKLPTVISASGLAVGTVASCAGLGYDPSALRDSAGLAAKLEEAVEGMQLPTRVRIAVSGSPLHRAETLTRDLGLAGVPGGWEIYAGGSAQAEVRSGVLLCIESSDERAVETAAAFLQRYREEAYYGETTGQWVERMGLLSLREGLLHPERRGEWTHRLLDERLRSAAAGSLYTNKREEAAVGR
ncbi:MULTISPECIES: nitrite reductase large subunit NirB [Paenibacillus]|uniref:nitrite reductase large subunit NirB n=1 Tax=Paenibacillus TaxID=44249 RepID=UPI0022B90E93|nr:nitrite reductase large subunit NirB [Paenibacillus caseinilyticus]MCZ8522626.1 nitrite reductase large subunit NirB [Paenibacillus caseinilyticus]